MEHVGVDLGRAESQISILTEAGELVASGFGPSGIGSSRCWEIGREPES